jgi:hypothetical protein
MGKPRKKPIAKPEPQIEEHLSDQELADKIEAENESIGFGDTFKKVMDATGISKVVEFIAGEDCGCDERRAKWNKVWRYKQPKCLLESEYEFLSGIIGNRHRRVDYVTRNEIYAIYNRVFSTKKKPTSCGTCLQSMVNDLTIIYNEYK